MYAIIETGGKQYRVEEGDFIYVEKLDAEENAEVVFGSLPVDNKLKIDGLGFTVLKTKGSHK